MQGNLEGVYFNIVPICDIEDGKRYRITLSIDMSRGFIENVKFLIDDRSYDLDYIKCDRSMAIFEKEIDLMTKAIYHYYFSFEENGKLTYFKRNNIDDTWKMKVNFDVPDWAKGKIIYHIFVDRFKKGVNDNLKPMKGRMIYNSFNDDMINPLDNGMWNTDFYGGNLRGIIESLDYIKSLGVTILYLSPIFKSSSNHRYDTGDYEEIDPYIGSESDLMELCNKAHEKGMKIILDGVFNHTGNDSKYFNELGSYKELGAYQSDDSPFSSFYRKVNGEFDYWWGMKNLPVCDGHSITWQDYIYGENGIIDKWFKLGIDGLRLDVADELTDEFIEGIRKAVKRNKDGFIIGEVWKNPMRMNREYISSGKCMDSVMNYPLADALIRYFKYSDVLKLKEVINSILIEYPDDTIYSLMNFTSTHDISRIINILGSDRFQEYGEWAWNLLDDDYNKSRNFKLSDMEYQRGKDIYEAYLFALAFLPGNLSIFYGDEIGIQGEGNLYNRKPFIWDNRDKELLSFVKYIGMIRNKENLETADLNILDINDKYFMFERITDDIKTLVAVSRTCDYIELLLPDEYKESGKIYSLNKSSEKVLRPYGGVSIRKR